MSWMNMLSNVLPFFGGDSSSNSDIITPSRSTDPNVVHWLYTWERTNPYLKETTEFERTIGHFQYTDVVGHPWCNSGYGDAMTLVVSQLMKSEVAVMLNNAAANIDNRTDGLIWDESQSRFVLSNNSSNMAMEDDGAGVDAGVIMPLLASVIAKFFDDTSMGSKMRAVTDMICQLSDAEAEAQVFDDSVYFCYVEDIVAATLICGESEQSVDCPTSLNQYTHTKEDFPSSDCIIANHTLHKGSIPNVINFSDNELIVPLLMLDLIESSREKKLPRFIPTSVAMQESLTYLLLYRSCIISASYSRQPYLCGADQVKAPILIPGWSLPKVLTMMPEGDPIFAIPSSSSGSGSGSGSSFKFASERSKLKNDAVPLVFISQSTVSPCSFVITIRGTATMVEWIQDFEYGQTPFFAHNQIKTHVGFTRILSSILPSLELFLTQQSLTHQCNCHNTHIFLTGHSLGAGVAQLLALHLALKFKQPPRAAGGSGNPTRGNPKGAGINFGTPSRNHTLGKYVQGVNEPYTKHLITQVNSRAWNQVPTTTTTTTTTTAGEAEANDQGWTGIMDIFNIFNNKDDHQPLSEPSSTAGADPARGSVHSGRGSDEGRASEKNHLRQSARRPTQDPTAPIDYRTPLEEGVARPPKDAGQRPDAFNRYHYQPPPDHSRSNTGHYGGAGDRAGAFPQSNWHSKQGLAPGYGGAGYGGAGYGGGRYFNDDSQPQRHHLYNTPNDDRAYGNDGGYANDGVEGGGMSYYPYGRQLGAFDWPSSINSFIDQGVSGVKSSYDSPLNADSMNLGLYGSIRDPYSGYETSRTKRGDTYYGSRDDDGRQADGGRGRSSPRSAPSSPSSAPAAAPAFGAGGCPNLDISAVVFAPPRVLNSFGSEQYRRLINGRIILDSGDGLAYMPCYEGNSKAGWPRCGPDHMSRTSGVGRDHYADNYGIVEIDVEYTEKRGGKTIDTLMQGIFPAGGGGGEPSILSTLFSRLVEVGVPGLGRIPSLGALGASHVCSAACKFSQAACGSQFKWWCDKCPMLI